MTPSPLPLVACALLLACGSSPSPSATAPTPAAQVTPPAADPGATPPAAPWGMEDGGAPAGQGFGNGHGRLGKPAGKPNPHITTGEFTGTLRDATYLQVQKHAFEMDDCYAEALARTPDLAGRVSVKFVVGTKGTVKDANGKESNLPDPKVVECFVRIFSTMKYAPAPKAPVTMVAPLDLTPGPLIDGN